MAPPEYDATGVEYHTIPSFTFQSGTTLHNLKVAYRIHRPKSDDTASPSRGYILIPTCFGGHINTTLTFPDALLSSAYTVIVAAMLSNGESASSSNTSFFPLPGELRYEDVVHAHHHLLTTGLGVTSLEAVIGFSMGGQQAYHWSVMYPDFVRRIVVICGSARTSPHNYAFLEGPVSALTNSIDYVAYSAVKEKLAKGETVGPNLKEIKPKRGLTAFFRAYSAWLTSAEWYAERWWGKSPQIQSGNESTTSTEMVREEVKPKALGFESVEAFISSNGEKSRLWDADDLLTLARMWQMGDIGRTYARQKTELGWKDDDDDKDDEAEKGDEMLKTALASINCPVLLLPCRTDQYFRPAANEWELRFLRKDRQTDIKVIESVWGHVAGGGLNPVDVEFMSNKIVEFISCETTDPKTDQPTDK